MNLAIAILGTLALQQGGDAQDKAMAEVEAAKRSYYKLANDWEQKYQQPKGPYVPPPPHPCQDSLPKFKAMAEQHEGTDAAAAATAFVYYLGLQAGKRAEALQALDALTTRYLSSPAIEEFPNQLIRTVFDDETVTRALRSFAEKGALQTRAQALYVMALRIINENCGDNAKGEAREFLLAAKKNFPARRVPELVEEMLAFLDRFAIGAEAPDFVTTDQDGRPWKLSDYRGRVVVLDFWVPGWKCCGAELPGKKALVERLKGKPFSFLGVISHNDLEKVKGLLKEEGVAWRQGIDGIGESRIAQAWRPSKMPTAIVIDAKGIIRYKRVSGVALDEAVETLLKEGDQAAPAK